jgi:hypothetical protein
LIDDKTSKSDKASRSLKWPTKKRDEELPTEINLPDGSYYRVTRENGRAVLQAKRFIAGIDANVIKPYKAELTRWFEAQTGYHPPEKIPDRELGHAEMPVEFARGSYGWVQLVRQETPEYKGAIGQVRGALKDMVDKKPVKQFKYTLDGDGVPFVNIKSLATFLSDEGMRTNKLVKVGHRYSVTP